ncbi:MAG: DUF4214 domain-containing protein [Acidobacteriota bacterium]
MRSTDAGVNWSAPQALTTEAWDHNFPTVAATSEGYVFIAWQDQRDGADPAGKGDIYVVRSSDGGVTFGSPVRMTVADNYPSRVPSIYAQGANVYLIWFDIDPVTHASGLFFRKSTDSGATWSSTKIVTTNDGVVDNEHPKIVKDQAGRLHVIFRSTRLGDPQGGFPPYDVFHYLSLDEGATWLPPAAAVSPVLPLDTANCFGADMTVSTSGALHVSWWEAKNGMNVFYRRSPDGGLTWGPVVQLSDYGFEHKEPNPQLSGALQGDTAVIADTQGRIYVLWHGFQAVSSANITYGELLARCSLDDGRTFEPLGQPDGGLYVSNIDVASTSSKIHVFYEGHNRSGQADEIEYRYSSTVNNQAPDAVIVSPGDSDLKIKPNVAFTFEGTASDPDGSVQSYLWDWGGARANTSTGAGSSSRVTVSFPNYGVYTVRLIPTDDLLEPDPTPPSFRLIVADISDNAFFVRQLYYDFLNRAPEPGGLNFWLDELNSGRRTRAQVTWEFFKSAEFQGNGAFVARLYAGVLFRRAEYEGFMFWLNSLNNGSWNRMQVVNYFISSPEFQYRFGGNLTHSEFVRRLYLNILLREPDTGGLNFWVGKLARGEMTRSEVTVNFVDSPEYVAQTENSIFVQLEYIGLLRRTAEDAGYDFWINEFSHGRSKLDLIQLFLDSPEYRWRFEVF